MDKVLAKKPAFYRYWKWLLGGFILLLLLLSSLFLFNEQAISIERSRISLATVQMGQYQDQIAVIGQLEPVNTRLLDAVVGGRIEERLAEPGQFVVAGQPLLRLSNTSLQLDFMQRETQLVEQMNQLRNIRITLEMNQQRLEDQLLQLDTELRLMERQYALQKRLYAENAIAKVDFENTQDQYVLLQKRQKLLAASEARERAFRNSQLQHIDASIQQMERNLHGIHKLLDQLTLRAPISGQLTAFEAEIGENKNAGQNIGRIDRLDSFKVRALVDEHFLAQLKPGLSAGFQFNGQNFKLQVSRVLPQVNAGQFTVDLQFIDSLPKSLLLRGQSLPLRIALGSNKTALTLAAGAYYQSSGGTYVYVLENEQKAQKRKVQLGRQNPEMIEVISGLKAGDKIISSSYRHFENAQTIQIKP